MYILLSVGHHLCPFRKPKRTVIRRVPNSVAQKEPSRKIAQHSAPRFKGIRYHHPSVDYGKTQRSQSVRQARRVSNIHQHFPKGPSAHAPTHSLLTHPQLFRQPVNTSVVEVSQRSVPIPHHQHHHHHHGSHRLRFDRAAAGGFCPHRLRCHVAVQGV